MAHDFIETFRVRTRRINGTALLVTVTREYDQSSISLYRGHGESVPDARVRIALALANAIGMHNARVLDQGSYGVTVAHDMPRTAAA